MQAICGTPRAPASQTGFYVKHDSHIVAVELFPRRKLPFAVKLWRIRPPATIKIPINYPRKPTPQPGAKHHEAMILDVHRSPDLR